MNHADSRIFYHNNHNATSLKLNQDQVLSADPTIKIFIDYSIKETIFIIIELDGKMMKKF